MTVDALRALAAALLDERAPNAALETAAQSLFRLFVAIAGPPSENEDTALPGGVGLSPVNAGNCLLDARRTAVLLRAVLQAIREGRTEVVYAGTGPFAALALPLMSILGSGEARFTLLDVHEESCRSVSALVEHFGFNGHVRAVKQIDATSYRHEQPIDVAIIEVMQRALSKEPQVEIARNLSHQLSGRGVLVPEEIVVALVIGDEKVGPVCRLDVRGLRTHDVILPRRTAGARASFATSIRAFGTHVLEERESGLTVAEFVRDLYEWREGQRIIFTYETGRSPGLRWSV